ncbi:MAG: prepilin-type N-terminal cleavage/methylation domain-containing protein [Candidatus Nanopelagicaceae bacterium]|nr:prepilin-type N-terminal cleavage/methylation domain-containing protein [Candidatus Nanopelagicaceae bacterium]
MIEKAQRDANLRDRGFTLLELLITSTLSIIVVMIAGGLLINGLRTQEMTHTVTDASNTAQQVVRSVQAGVKNASAITVMSDAVTGTQLLLARTISMDPASTAPSCQAWYYTPADGGAVYTHKTTPASLISLPADGPKGNWTILGTGISPSDPATGKVFNAPSGGRIELKFDVKAGEHPYVLINTMTYTTQSSTVSTPCF